MGNFTLKVKERNLKTLRTPILCAGLSLGVSMKVIELDQRTGEEIAVAEYEDEGDVKKAESLVKTLLRKAEAEGRSYLKYWVAY